MNINGTLFERSAKAAPPKRKLFLGRKKGNAVGVMPSKQPSWLENAGKVLSFQAYFKEAVVESPLESHRVRMVNILYYLAENKVEITEIRAENSGIPQGKFLQKTPIKKLDTISSEDGIRVGSTIAIFSRTYRVFSCDEQTAQYFAQKGNPQPPSEAPPADPYNTVRLAMKERDTGADQTIARGKKQNPLKKHMESSLGNASARMRVGTQADQLRSFLDHDGEVLRFYAIWDDSDSLYGQVHKYTINFYLASGEMEVLEVHRPNEGRDHFPAFLKKQKVERLRSTTIDGYGVNGVEEEADHAQIFLTVEDLVVGAHVHIHGREFLIHDADEFTYSTLEATRGVDHRPNRIDVDQPEVAMPEVPLPPHNGIGDPEDSEQNCRHLVPKPPKHDFAKAMAFAPTGTDQMMLRFQCCMATTNPLDQNRDRRFVAAFRLADDTVEVYEPPARNSGILGGKFMRRCKSAYSPADLAAAERFDGTGAAVEFNRTPFKVLGKDEYTRRWLEANGHGGGEADGGAPQVIQVSAKKAIGAQ
jgi:hypothetical protein